MRARLVIAILLSSLDLFAQNGVPTSPPVAQSSHDPQAQQKADSTTRPPQGDVGERPTSACGHPAGDETKVVSEKVVTPGPLIHKVAPKYPKAARKAHIQGTVVLCAAITKEGNIVNLRAVSGPELLIPPAVEAVRQWRYRPYLLNGEAVEVDTEIRVNFTLGGLPK